LTPSLGAKLRELRQAAKLTQDAAAKRLGVSRPNLTQWESDRYRPSAEHLDKLDELYGARGELRRLAAGPQSNGPDEPSRQLHVADVFRDVADALVDAVVKDDDGNPEGWGRSITDTTPTRLHSAYVIRTLQLLDDARVDLHRLAHIFGDPTKGYGYRREAKKTRPEVTAVILATLARLGQLSDADAALDRLSQDIDEFAEKRPFILAVVLEAVLAIRPQSELAYRLTRALLDSRLQYPGYTLWTMNAAAPVARTTPSLAHTARATAILRIARSTTRYQSEVDEAIKMAVEWMSDLHKRDVGAIETLERAENVPPISIHHFTSAWVIRSLAGIKSVSRARIESALKTLWESYSTTDRLWTWRDDGSLPSWMTLDAVSALRALAEASLATPLSTKLDEDR
jgi:transcriptional regulator with XRE-family HTH domain